MTQGLLSGVTVLDLSRVFAGPYATMLLADLGATVWKVEPPSGDETRGWGPPFWGDPGDRRSAYFASVNRNKRSIVLDLKTDGGRAVLDRLAAQADLLMHNYQPSVAARLGVDPDRLRRVHPHLVVSAVGGFHGAGEAAERPAYDLVAQAFSGQMMVTGEVGGGPVKIGVGLLDLLAGLEAGIGALAGLLGRARSGGALAPHASVSLVEAATAGLANVLGFYLATGQEPRRWGTGHPDIVPYQVFEAADGHVVVAVGNDAQFSRLLEVLGLDERTEWATNADRLAQRAEVLTALEPRIRARSRDAFVAEMTASDIPGGPVNGVGEALTAMREVDPDWITFIDGIPQSRSPIRVNGEPLPLLAPPPRLGEHTDEILAEAGLTASEIAAFRESVAFGQAPSAKSQSH